MRLDGILALVLACLSLLAPRRPNSTSVMEIGGEQLSGAQEGAQRYRLMPRGYPRDGRPPGPKPRGHAMPRLDWDRPLMFENGCPAVLLETCMHGFVNYPDRTRLVQQVGVEGMSGLWYVKEDGRSGLPGFSLRNA